MRAVSCTIAVATALTLVWGARTPACAQPADPPIVNKTPQKARKDKGKADKKPDKNQ